MLYTLDWERIQPRHRYIPARLVQVDDSPGYFQRIDLMKTKTMLIHLLVSLVVLSACAPAEGAEPLAPTAAPMATEKPTETRIATKEPTTSPTATEAPISPGYYPLSTRTGIAEVDEVLAAVESGDDQALRDLIRFTTVGCTNAEGLGGPPKCRAGEAEGTRVNVLPLLGPEGSFIHESDVSSIHAMDVIGIYAVYSVSDSAYSEEAYPAGEYAAMFTTEDDQIVIVLQIRKGIVRMDTVYSPISRESVIQRDASELILAPK